MYVLEFHCLIYYIMSKYTIFILNILQTLQCIELLKYFNGTQDVFINKLSNCINLIRLSYIN